MAKAITEAVEALVRKEAEKLNEDGAKYRKLLDLLLNSIQSNLKAAERSAEFQLYDSAASQFATAKGFLEILEVFDCGHVGGFSHELTKKHGRNATFKQRVDFILTKYGSK